jgi:2-polyprenyl-3-methyl-5-hydroxy-6-metoxy-1,4-benzoquinol methylase
MTRLTKAQAAAYWDERHRTSDPWRAGGHRGLDEKANELFYYVRFGLVLRMLANHFGYQPGLRILDAGCGRGWLTGQFRALGFDAMGVDQSSEAIRHARETYDAPFFVAARDEFDPDQRFDAVISMDVLFHITDGEQWERSLRNLARLLDDKGVLIFSDCLPEDARELGDYIVYRSRSGYERVLSACSLTMTTSEPYQVFGHETSWHLCARFAVAPREAREL